MRRCLASSAGLHSEQVYDEERVEAGAENRHNSRPLLKTSISDMIRRGSQCSRASHLLDERLVAGSAEVFRPNYQLPRVLKFLT